MSNQIHHMHMRNTDIIILLNPELEVYGTKQESEIMTTIVPVPEIMRNIRPVREITKTYCCGSRKILIFQSRFRFIRR